MTTTTTIPDSPIAFDYHTHNVLCGHASGVVEEYVGAAISVGLSELGASDHAPAYFLQGDRPLPTTVMARSELFGYVGEVLRLKRMYENEIVVQLGIEADFMPSNIQVYRDALAAHPFDYVIGSVHWVGDDNIMVPQTWARLAAEDPRHDPQQIYRAYYDLVVRSARTGLWDILAHLTAAECFGPPIADDVADEWYPKVADAAAESGCVVEINTSGYRKMRTTNDEAGDVPFPNPSLLRLLVARGVPLTFGSDAHRPADVGYGRAKAAQLLRELGLSQTPTPVTVRRGPILAFRR